MLENWYHLEDETPYPLPKGSMTGILPEWERERLLEEWEELLSPVEVEQELHRKKMAKILARNEAKRKRESVQIPDNHPQLAWIRNYLFREVVKKQLIQHPKWTFREEDENGLVLFMINTKGKIKRLPIGKAAIRKNHWYKHLYF